MGGLIKTREETRKIRKSAKILARVIRRRTEKTKPGIQLIHLDGLARELIEKAGGKPAFLGYQPAGAQFPFPYTLCTSLNEVVVHGRPSAIELRSGDILKLDLGVNLDGGISDAAVTLAIGQVDKKTNQLIQTTKEALSAGIKEARAGNRLGDIGYAIEEAVKRNGFSVIEDLTGHGVGLELLEEGMVLAIEPMTSMGSGKIVQLADDSFATFDHSFSAHFEHTVLVTKRGGEILTI